MNPYESSIEKYKDAALAVLDRRALPPYEMVEWTDNYGTIRLVERWRLEAMELALLAERLSVLGITVPLWVMT